MALLRMGHGEGFNGDPPTLDATTSAIAEVPEAERWTVDVRWTGGV